MYVIRVPLYFSPSIGVNTTAELQATPYRQFNETKHERQRTEREREKQKIKTKKLKKIV